MSSIMLKDDFSIIFTISFYISMPDKQKAIIYQW